MTKGNQNISMRKNRTFPPSSGFYSTNNTLYTDFKAELVASGLVESGISMDTLRILRKGKALRGKAKEIDQISWENSEHTFSEFLNIHIHKRDLYESLPEGLFHQGTTSENKRGKMSVLESIKQNKQEEFNARYFFKPFEISIDRMLVSAQLYERRLEKREKHSEFIHLLTADWKILQTMPLHKALFILNFLSQSHRITSPEQISQILSVFLDCQVVIEQTCSTIFIPDDTKWKLGDDARLGLTTFMGGGITDCFPVVNVRLNNLQRKHKELLSAESPAYKQFISLLDLFLPADVELVLSMKSVSEETSFLLSDRQEEVPILGLTTVLK